MTSKGLQEVANPSELFVGEHKRGPGSVLVSAIEGSRPILLEIQALASRTHFGLPRRMVTGIDLNRTLLLIAVIEKRLGLNLQNHDVFVNVTGGVKVKEPAMDLGIVSAIVGAFGNTSPDGDGIIAGEVGLGGEIRPVPQIPERVREAERLGLAWAVVPKRSIKGKMEYGKIKVIGVENLTQVMEWMKT
jgi:DNA repair protein RadA/Sms